MIKDIKYDGYTAVPSDYECSDGELAGSYNMAPEDGAMHPILPPEIRYYLPVVQSPATGEYKVLFVHHPQQNYKHYIVLGPDGKLYYFNEASSFPAEVVALQDYSNVPADTDATSSALAKCYLHKIADTVFTSPQVNAIGNTLIVNSGSGIDYFLWSTDTTAHYEALGQKPPMLEITFGLHSDFAVYPDTKNVGDSNQSDYRGTIIEFGNLLEPVVPPLGNDDTQIDAWAAPKPVMAANTDTGSTGQKIRRFASEYATHSIEGMEGGTDNEKNSISKFRNMLSSSVFANLNKFVNDLGTNKNKFVLPFFVRYAYRLYDNSYIMHSYPVLMIPNSRGPIFALDGYRGLCLNDNDDNYVETKIRGRIYGCLSTLVYNINGTHLSSIQTELNKWKDLITSIDIGVSAPIYAYDQSGDVLGWTNMDGTNDWEEYYTISRIYKFGDKSVENETYNQWLGVQSFKTLFQTFDTKTRHSGDSYGDYFNRYSTYNYPNYIATIPLRKTEDVRNSITGAANFYVIKQFTVDEILQGSVSEAELEMEDGTLGGLLGRKRIADDYYTHDTLKASLVHPFNGRVNYAGIERTPHNPISPAIQFPQANSTLPGDNWQITVSIKNDMQTLVVQSARKCENSNFPHWIFYPDANAKLAYVNDGTYTYELKLTPHDYLNGAYWLGDITKQDATPSSGGSVPSTTSGGFLEYNKVYTSNVNNPFVFEPTNINTIGTGKIVAICPAVKPLAQDQFGKAPLYVFTDEGVWAMDTTNTGTYSVVWPLAPDVTINPDSITQIDDTVFFATNRGIMVISGNKAQCVSDMINSESPFTFSDLFKTTAALNQWNSFLSTNNYDTSGLTQVPFSTFLAGCRMIYDYVHQRIVVFNTAQNYAYIYSLKEHKWGMMTTSLDYGINSYPDALAVTDDHKIINLCKGIATGSVKGIIVTRPLKLDQPDSLKTIDTIIQRGKFDFLKSGRTPKPIRTILYGSRDLYDWFMIASSTDHYLRGFSGTPYKYFRIVLLCDMFADESVYGATIQYRPRYLNRPR